MHNENTTHDWHPTPLPQWADKIALTTYYTTLTALAALTIFNIIRTTLQALA